MSTAPRPRVRKEFNPNPYPTETSASAARRPHGGTPARCQRDKWLLTDKRAHLSSLLLMLLPTLVPHLVLAGDATIRDLRRKNGAVVEGEPNRTEEARVLLIGME